MQITTLHSTLYVQINVTKLLNILNPFSIMLRMRNILIILSFPNYSSQLLDSLGYTYNISFFEVSISYIISIFNNRKTPLVSISIFR